MTDLCKNRGETFAKALISAVMRVVNVSTDDMPFRFQGIQTGRHVSHLQTIQRVLTLKIEQLLMRLFEAVVISRTVKDRPRGHLQSSFLREYLLNFRP